MQDDQYRYHLRRGYAPPQVTSGQVNCALLNGFVLESIHQQLASVFAVRTDCSPFKHGLLK